MEDTSALAEGENFERLENSKKRGKQKKRMKCINHKCKHNLLKLSTHLCAFGVLGFCFRK